MAALAEELQMEVPDESKRSKDGCAVHALDAPLDGRVCRAALKR